MKRRCALLAFGLAAACGPDHRAQCNALVERVSAISDGITKGGGMGQEDGLSDLARSIDRARPGLRELQLADPALRKDREDYEAVLGRISAAANEMSGAAKRKDSAALQRDLEVIQAAARDESASVARINRDCAEK
jgi:hypothetical protein